MNDIVVAIVPAIVIFVAYLGGVLCFHLIRMWLDDRRSMRDFQARRALMLEEISTSLTNRHLENAKFNHIFRSEIRKDRL